jgi:hypothetical protein
MLRMIGFGIFLLVFAAVSVPAMAADLVIYDDALQNSFVNYSYVSAGGSVNLSNTAPVHSGTHSIAFTAAGFDAVKVANNSQLFDVAAYPRLHLWFYGSTAQCQGLDIILERSNGANPDVTVGSGALSAYAACNAIINGQWLEVIVNFTASPIGYNGTYDRISLFNRNGAMFGPVYFDDLALQSAGSDEIFRNGFEPGEILVEQNVPCAGTNLISERYTWHDASGWLRSATLSHNDTGANAAHEGELCDYTYHTDAINVRDVQELTAGGAGGFGYIVSHLVYQSAAYNAAIANDGDDSPLGHGFTGTYTRLLNGRHHAILRFQVNYPRWGVPASNVPTKYNVPVTIDWLIATGRDHPLWSISYDLTAAPANAIKADSRAPYGDMAFDGAGTAAGYGGIVGGVAWGDHYKFTTTSAPMTLNSSWTWNVPNTIPYVYLWTNSVDAEMGIVQSEDIAKQDAGSEFSYINWNQTSAIVAGGLGCPATNNVMPCVDYQWAYQANADDSSNTSEPDKHLTWGTGYGFLGRTAYNTDGSLTSTGVGWPRQSYSTYVVFGLHGPTPTDHQVTQVENAMSSTLSASVGSLVTPSGYNPVYATWEVNAAAGAATLTLNATGSGLVNPVFIIHNHANALPSTVTLDGTTLTADVDYFATADAANADHADTRLWITVNRTWVGSHSLTVN